MKLPKHLSSKACVCLMLWIASLGCDSRPKQPINPIPKAPAADKDWNFDLRAEFEAANRPKDPGTNATAADASRQTPEVPTASKETEPLLDKSESQPWLDSDGSQLPMEYWETQYFNAQRIGITRYKIEAEKRGLRIRMETSMRFVRGNQSLRQSIVIQTTEQFNGHLDHFMETLTSGAVTSRTDALVNSNEMRITTESGERNAKKQIQWPAGSWGPLGIHQMLLRKPMLAGESRRAKVFLPQMHQLAEVTLVAGNPESTTSPDGLLRDVLPIEVIMQLEKEGIRVRMWSDALGRIQKTIWPEGLNLSSYRISPETANRLQAEDEIEDYRKSSLDCEPTVLNLAETAQVQFTITSEQPDPYSLFSGQGNQIVKPKPVHDALITVLKPSWQGSASGWPKQLEPTLKELNSSTWLPSDKPEIERLAKQWTEPATEPVEVAQALLAATHKNLRKLDFTADIHKVEVVARNLEGDCTEHAMLLAALLRNRQIASRIASGVRLNQQDGQAKFEYHMWTEAWLNNSWIAMDATTGQLTNCEYLKFLESPLADSDPYQTVLSVLKNLKALRVVRAE